MTDPYVNKKNHEIQNDANMGKNSLLNSHHYSDQPSAGLEPAKTPRPVTDSQLIHCNKVYPERTLTVPKAYPLNRESQRDNGRSFQPNLKRFEAGLYFFTYFME